MAYLPLFFNTYEGKPVLIVGGGEIACAKAEALSSVEASVVVAAPQISGALRRLAAKKGIALEHRSYAPDLLEGKPLVIAATNNDGLNAQIAADCRARNIPVNVVDNPQLCDFIFPALVRRGPLQIAISTSGIAPVLARMIKQDIEKLIPAKFERLVDFMAEKKDVLRGRLKNLQPRRLFSEEIIRGPIAEDLLEGNRERAEKSFAASLDAWPDLKQGALYLIGAGPGHPELMTLKAVRLLSQADVILYDRLIPEGIIEQYARKDAQKIPVGKARGKHHQEQDDICAQIEKFLSEKRIVARLKGGDPGIYAHAAEEIDVARRLDMPYQIVPGITAATGCAAYAGIPLTERGGANAVRLMTLYSRDMENETFWQKLEHAQDETLVFYMSMAHSRIICERLMEKKFPSDTPVLVIEQGTTAYHREYRATLGSFVKQYGDLSFISPGLLIVGEVARWQETHSWKQTLAGRGAAFPIPLEGRKIPEISIVKDARERIREHA